MRNILKQCIFTWGALLAVYAAAGAVDFLSF